MMPSGCREGQRMGYYEQIGVENERHRQRRASMNPAQRRVKDFALNAIGMTASLVLWALVLIPPVAGLIQILR